MHRIYLPEHTNIGSNDLMEKLSEISKQKKDQDTVIKDLEGQRRKLELELKLKKKQYHKVLQRHIKQLGKHSKSKIYITSTFTIFDLSLFFFFSSSIHNN